MNQNKLTAIEAAKLLGCSVSFIRQQAVKGNLAHTKLGSRYSFKESDVLNLVKLVEPHNNDTDVLE